VKNEFYKIVPSDVYLDFYPLNFKFSPQLAYTLVQHHVSTKFEISVLDHGRTDRHESDTWCKKWCGLIVMAAKYM